MRGKYPNGPTRTGSRNSAPPNPISPPSVPMGTANRNAGRAVGGFFLTNRITIVRSFAANGCPGYGCGQSNDGCHVLPRFTVRWLDLPLVEAMAYRVWLGRHRDCPIGNQARLFMVAHSLHRRSTSAGRSMHLRQAPLALAFVDQLADRMTAKSNSSSVSVFEPFVDHRENCRPIEWLRHDPGDWAFVASDDDCLALEDFVDDL